MLRPRVLHVGVLRPGVLVQESYVKGSSVQWCYDQAPVVQKVDNAIQRINVYPLDSVIGSPNSYPLDRDLSGG